MRHEEKARAKKIPEMLLGRDTGFDLHLYIFPASISRSISLLLGNSGNLKENALVLEKLQGADFGLPSSIFGPRNMLTVFVTSAIPRMNKTWILRMSFIVLFPENSSQRLFPLFN